MAIIKLRVRLSFPNLWVPAAPPARPGEAEGQKAYSCNGLIHLDDPQVEIIQRTMLSEAEKKWKNKPPVTIKGVSLPGWRAVYDELENKDKLCLHNGDFKSDYDGYAGMYFLTARNTTKPLIVDKDPFIRDDSGAPLIDPKTGKPVPNLLTEDSGRPYGGCYVNLSVDIYAQDNQYGRRVNASLRGVQYLGEGDAFAGGPPATPDEFDDLSTGSNSLV